MKTNTPDISIIMATFNRAHLISEALDSIIEQTKKNWECIIVDDGSTDNTEAVVKSYLDEDLRFKYFKRTSKYKKGLPGARNMGIDLAIGKTIIFFDDDDVIHPDNLKINFDILSSGSASFCRYNKKPFTVKRPKFKIQENNYSITQVGIQEIGSIVMGDLSFASCTVMWDKKCFDNQRFNEELQYAEEWELYSRILSKGFEGVSIDKVLYFNRKHSNSNTGEFWDNDTIRRASKVKAAKIIISNLSEKKLLSDSLNLYFIRLGFFLRDFSVINEILLKSNANFFQKRWYKMRYILNPYIRPFRLLRKKIHNKK